MKKGFLSVTRLDRQLAGGGPGFSFLIRHSSMEERHAVNVLVGGSTPPAGAFGDASALGVLSDCLSDGAGSIPVISASPTFSGNNRRVGE
jgi:hypothetical protein